MGGLCTDMLRRQATQGDALDGFMGQQGGPSSIPKRSLLRRMTTFGGKLPAAEITYAPSASPGSLPQKPIARSNTGILSAFSPRKKAGSEPSPLDSHGQIRVKWEHVLNGAKMAADKKSFRCAAELVWWGA